MRSLSILLLLVLFVQPVFNRISSLQVYLPADCEIWQGDLSDSIRSTASFPAVLPVSFFIPHWRPAWGALNTNVAKAWTACVYAPRSIRSPPSSLTV